MHPVRAKAVPAATAERKITPQYGIMFTSEFNVLWRKLTKASRFGQGWLNFPAALTDQFCIIASWWGWRREACVETLSRRAFGSSRSSLLSLPVRSKLLN